MKELLLLALVLAILAALALWAPLALVLFFGLGTVGVLGLLLITWSGLTRGGP